MKRTKHNGTILTNDPSMAAWGHAILNWKGDVLAVGCIKTEPFQKKQRIREGDSTVHRISEINQVLLQLIKKWNVEYILSELPHGSQSASAAVMIGVVTGILQTISDVLDIGIEWYSENDAKKSLFNCKSVTKQDMIKRIASLYTVPWTGIKYKDEGIADALAIYHAATQTSGTLKLLKFRK